MICYDNDMISEGQNHDWSDLPTILAAAHELKSPLVLIRQLALEYRELPTDEAAERIRLTAERSLQLVEGLTRASRLSGAIFESEPVSLGPLFDDIAHEMNPLANALGQKIEVRLGRNPVMAVGNRDLLRSVLCGLCDNALTHNDASQPIILSALRSGPSAIAQIRDFGPATGKLQSIRNSLGKTPQPVDSRPRSSGLGLLIAEQFARHMDGGLTLRRHRDRGVTFALTLPASRQLSLWGI